MGKCFLQGFACDAVEKIRLIFTFVFGAVKLAILHASIVACRNHIGTVFESGFEKELEFNLLVAHNIRIWRASMFVFVDHVVDDFVAVLAFEIEDLEINAELHGDTFCISQVLGPWAFHTRQVLAPVFHIHACYFVALLNK